MSKKIIRLTEGDLHNMISYAVNHIIRESLGQEGDYDALQDIMNGTVVEDESTFIIKPYEKDNFCDICVEGLSGDRYWIRVWGSGKVDTPAERGRFGGTVETDIEPCPATYENAIDYIEIVKETELGQEEEKIPYTTNQEFESWIDGMIDFDWSEYDEDKFY